MKLYTFFRSGTSHRLRIALNLKGLRYEQIAVDLRREQHLSDDYRRINPQQLVIESARRFKVDLARWPRLAAIDEACGRLDAFQRAAPAAQPDAA